MVRVTATAGNQGIAHQHLSAIACPCAFAALAGGRPCVDLGGELPTALWCGIVGDAVAHVLAPSAEMAPDRRRPGEAVRPERSGMERATPKDRRRREVSVTGSYAKPSRNRDGDRRVVESMLTVAESLVSRRPSRSLHLTWSYLSRIACADPRYRHVAPVERRSCCIARSRGCAQVDVAVHGEVDSGGMPRAVGIVILTWSGRPVARMVRRRPRQRDRIGEGTALRRRRRTGALRVPGGPPLW